MDVEILSTHGDKIALADKNVRLFIAFRAFFNARFYYPVFTILFLDFGLTLEQFALLNVAWAASIVLLEVPSGALADIFGRKNLLVFSATLMVIEMILLCIVPTGHPNLIFGVFLINRIFSGTAEAAASGADEALAYDALQQAGMADKWGRVLERQMRVQSMTYIGAMSLGAAVYDPNLVHHVLKWFGWGITITQSVTLRFPIYLTLVMAVLTLITTLRMEEINTHEPSAQGQSFQNKPSILNAFKLTLRAGLWILQTPFVFVVIMFGLLFDHTIRMLLTLNSQYFRLIELPEASFGVIGSGMATLGLFIPTIALKLVQRRSPSFNLAIITILTLTGLVGITFVWPLWGLLPMLVLSSVMYFSRFFVSHYLNQATPSEQRATVLSFKGLSYNLSYGLIGILYSILVATIRQNILVDSASPSDVLLENAVFADALGWFPWYFLILFAFFMIFARQKSGHFNHNHRT